MGVSNSPFTENASLQNPTGSTSLQLRWNGATPLSARDESNWVQALTSWGVPTP